MAQYEPPIRDFWDHSATVWSPVTATPIGALMATLPGHEPSDSLLDRLPLHEAIADCMDQLSSEDQFMLDAWYMEQVTIRALAERMGLHKSHTYRLVKRAETRLRDVCMLNVTVQMYLGIAGAIPPPEDGSLRPQSATAEGLICDGVA